MPLVDSQLKKKTAKQQSKNFLLIIITITIIIITVSIFPR